MSIFEEYGAFKGYFFLFLHENILWYSLEVPSQGTSDGYLIFALSLRSKYPLFILSYDSNIVTCQQHQPPNNSHFPDFPKFCFTLCLLKSGCCREVALEKCISEMLLKLSTDNAFHEEIYWHRGAVGRASAL